MGVQCTLLFLYFGHALIQPPTLSSLRSLPADVSLRKSHYDRYQAELFSPARATNAPIASSGLFKGYLRSRVL